MHDQPSAAELLGAIETFMRETAMVKLEGHAAFHARVAANALAIVKREVELAPLQTAAERKRLQQLLDTTEDDLEVLNRALCKQIRDGAIALDNDTLAEHLWQTTLEKVAIDQPKYSGYQKALEERGSARRSEEVK